MRIQYVIVFCILTEARKNKTKKSEPADEITVPPYQRYYKVPFGMITLEGFDPLAKGPLDDEYFDFRSLTPFRSTDPPDVAPFVPNNEDDSKANRRNWKRSKKNKKKRDKGSRAFGMSPGRAMDAPYNGDELPEGPDDDDRTQPKTHNKKLKTPNEGDVQRTNLDRAGMYMDFTKNFMLSVGQRYREGKSFAHGSRPDQEIAINPEPTEISQEVVEDKYYPERKIPDLPQYTPYSYIPPHLRNRFDDRNLNWTTCEEFGRDAEFYPKDIVNIEWVPFFVWSDTPAMTDSIVHTFEYPTVKLVQKYKNMASPLLKKKLDWEAPKLLMKLKIVDGSNDMLIIAANRKGKFDGIRYMTVPEDVKDLMNAMPYPVLGLHLKSIGSYLAMMYCDEQYAVIMAPTGTEPITFDAARRGAAFLNFNGIGYAVQRNLEKEQMLMQEYQMDSRARMKAREDRTVIPSGPRDAFFPFNREPPLDML